MSVPCAVPCPVRVAIHALRERREFSEMSHLPASADFGLAVEMERCATGRVQGPVRGFLANDVLHHRVGVTAGMAERPAGDGADVLLELADEAGIDGPMTGIMHARRDLVDQELIASDEQFDGK